MNVLKGRKMYKISQKMFDDEIKIKYRRYMLHIKNINKCYQFYYSEY